MCDFDLDLWTSTIKYNGSNLCYHMLYFIRIKWVFISKCTVGVGEPTNLAESEDLIILTNIWATSLSNTLSLSQSMATLLPSGKSSCQIR